MDQNVTHLLDAVKTRYGAEIQQQNLLGNSANMIYEINLREKTAILRLSKHSAHKELHVGFELAWMNELARHIRGIASPIPSEHPQTRR